VVAADVAGSKVNATAGRLVAIEAGALPADTAQQINPGLLAQTRLVHAIEAEQEGAEGLATRPAIGALASFPSGVKLKAGTFVEDDVGADRRVKASLFGAEAGH